jgi:hypothetical protein
LKDNGSSDQSAGDAQYNRRGRQSILTKYKACEENVTDRKVGRPSIQNTELKSLETLCIYSALRLVAKGVQQGILVASTIPKLN